jgi:hypothetical protein
MFCSSWRESKGCFLRSWASAWMCCTSSSESVALQKKKSKNQKIKKSKQKQKKKIKRHQRKKPQTKNKNKNNKTKFEIRIGFWEIAKGKQEDRSVYLRCYSHQISRFLILSNTAI